MSSNELRAVLILLSAAALVGCGPQAAPTSNPVPPTTSGTSGGHGTSSSGGNTTGTHPGTGGLCAACSADADCAPGGSCIPDASSQTGNSCTSPCGANGACPAGDSCFPLLDAQGNPVGSGCFPSSGACSAPATTGSSTSTSSGSTSSSSSGTTGASTTSSGSTSSTSSSTSAGSTSGSTSSTSGTSSGSTTTGTTSSGSTTGTSGSCPGYADPNTAASCPCASGHTCAANGCYGGWYCELSNDRCVSPPTSCSGTSSTSTSSGSTSGTTSSTTTSGGTTSGTTTGGTTGGVGNWTGSVSTQGGTVSRLYFAAVGDARPPNEDDTSAYPTAIITQIFQDMAAQNPEFIVSTGDYMYANPSGSAGAAQLALYLQARQAYPGVLFASMGNHECTGYTASNCLSTSSSNNYAAFMQQLIAPLGQTKPYYRYDVNDSAGQWTAKFIVLAMNSWDSTQGTWLQQQLAQPTTYTFIIRHEPESATTAPGVTPSDNIISQYPYTLKIVGHTHEFSQAGARQVIVGNGGAPLSGSGTYGYAVIEQTANGDIQVTQMDYSSNSPISSFTVAK